MKALETEYLENFELFYLYDILAITMSKNSNKKLLLFSKEELHVFHQSSDKKRLLKGRKEIKIRKKNFLE